MTMTTEAERHPEPPAPKSATLGFVFQNRRAISALLIFVTLMVIFTAANPKVFLSNRTYSAVFLSLPVTLFVAVPLVFVVAAGEIDLSFPAVVGVSSWAFALALRAGWDPFLAMIPAIIVGLVTGLAVGLLVAYADLSSLIATLGMNFLLRGLINIGSQGLGIQFPEIKNTILYQIFASKIEKFPVQMIWGLLFVAVGWLIFNLHKSGAHVRFVGDNPDSAQEMGINVKRVRVCTYIFVGFGAALAGVLSVLINRNWWPTTGDGLMLPTLAAVFVGGTPTWGGVATVVGSSIGVFVIAFIETGIIAAGLTGYYTRFFNGLVIILSMIGHRFNAPRYR
jgi:ribose/xylose/arabinose/galactoside ABC-type transport system permease subunit